MKVHFDVPDHIWAQIVTKAEDRGTTAAHMLSAAALTLVQQDTGAQVRAMQRRKRVVDLVRNGYTDKQVAEITGELKMYVTQQRARVGLPANRRAA